MISEREMAPVDIQVLPAAVEIKADLWQLIEGSAAVVTDQVTAGIAEERKVEEEDLTTADQSVPVVKMTQPGNSEIMNMKR